MEVSYRELNQKVAGDLRGWSVAGDNAVTIQDSGFAEVPQGSKAKLKPVSFSKLEAGDFILVSSAGAAPAVRRFLRLDMSGKTTHLRVATADKQEESISFTRLMGRVESVRRGEVKVNPNPRGLIQRLAFRFNHRFTVA